jgi:hypothetical protein
MPDDKKGGRPFYKLLDAVATAPLRAQRRLKHRLWQLLSPRSSNYDRVAAVVHVCNRFAPGVATRWSSRLLRYDTLPFAAAFFTPHAFGTGATVFRVEGSGQPRILKVYRRTLGQDRAQLLGWARYYRQKYATVCRWYGGGPLHVVPASYLVLNAPLLAAPAVGKLQPYVEAPMKDLFLDFSNAELLALAEEEPDLRAQLRYFCRQTLAIATSEGRCLDFVGRDNVSLSAEAPGKHRLIILDYGVFDLAEKRVKAPEAFKRVMHRLRRLETLLQAIEQERLAEVAASHAAGQG